MSSNLKWANQKHAYRSRKIVWLCSLLVISIITWAAYSKLEEVVVGDGKVVPTLAIQKIQSLEGGIIEQVLVKAGEQVKKGQPLIILDDTRFRTAFQESDEHYRTLQAQIKRLKAELDTVKVNTKEKDWKKQITINHQAIAFDDLSKRAQLNAKANYNERIGQIESQLEEAQLTIEQQTEALRDAKSNTSTLYSSLRLVNKEAKMLEGAVKRGAVAEVELIQTRRDQVKLRGEIASSKVAQQKTSAALREAIVIRRNLALEFRTSVQAQLNELTNQFAQLEDSQEGLADQLKRTEITAPMDGTIKDILVRSLGGVVKPGEPIMELVPNDSKLIVEARISPQDIAFVQTGLEATIKFTAYDFVVYGGRKGTVTYVSADALQTEDGTAYYRAHIQLHDDPETRLQAIPGMQAMVDILTGEKTVLSYWLKPLLRAKTSALREP